MSRPFILFLLIVMIFSAYTIYGGTLNKEQLEVKDFIDNYFNNIENVLGSREFDRLEAEAIKYNIRDINIEDGEADVNLHVTGIDNTQLTYELIMYHVFVEELAKISNEIVELPGSGEIYEFLIRKNIINTRETDLKIKLEKVTDTWKMTNESSRNLYDALRGITIETKILSDKAYENLNTALNIQKEKFGEEKRDITFTQYWINYLKKFILNKGYVTEFPFKEQVFSEKIDTSNNNNEINISSEEIELKVNNITELDEVVSKDEVIEILNNAISNILN